MLKEFKISVAPNGVTTAIYNDDLAGLFAAGKASVSRASFVEPAATGGWTADMAPVNGPVLGPFALREEALQAEAVYLDTALF